MATKRLKFLKRVKIRQHDIRIQLEVNGPVKRFKAALSLDAYGFPAEAKILVEAKQLMETIRFDFGTIGSTPLGGFHDVSRLKGERITFNVLVLDPISSRKLGTAWTVRPNVQPDVAESSIPLLPVDASSPLAPLLWDVAYVDDDQEGHSDAPVLRIDCEAAKHSAAFFMQDVAARAMILPAAMRQILTQVLLIDRTDYESDSRSWRNSWIRFGSRLAGEEPPDVEESNVQEEASAWIDRATGALAARADLLGAYLRERPE